MATTWHRRARRNRLLGEALKFLENAGAADITPKIGAKHLKIEFTHHGRRAVVIIPKAPTGNWRTARNGLCHLRRLVAP
jgi:hypothetical protein